MKKKLGKVLIGLFCIGLLGSCGSGEGNNEPVEEPITRAEVIEETEEKVAEDVIELPVIETEEEVVEEEQLQVTEEPVTEEETDTTEEVIEKNSVVEEIPAVKEPEYSYASLNQTMYASRSVNVRSLPSTDGEKLGGLSTAQAVAVTGKCNETGWYRIEYNGSEAYVSDSYLVDEKPVQQQEVTRSNSSQSTGASENAVTVPTYEDTVGNLVWVPTKGGKKYHTHSGCSGMEGPMQVTVDRAEQLGFTPCKRCH